MAAHPLGSDAGISRGDSSLTVGNDLKTYRSLVICDGTIEGLKWLALILMALDHVNKYLYAEGLPVIFSLGRIVLPLFGFVLAYNLARPDALSRGVHRRMMCRLALAGAAATPAFVILNSFFVVVHAWWPLNVLFMLLLVVLITYLIDRGGALRYTVAIVAFLLAGAVVEYLWWGILCCLGAWLFCREASPTRLLLWFIGTLALTAVNLNAWALAAIPVVLMASKLNLPIRRHHWAFYVFYPAHLYVLLEVRMAWF